MSERHILEEISDDYKYFYSKLVEIVSVDANNEAHAICPVHGDSKASMHINMDTGKWHCKACNTGGHDIISFYAFIHDMDVVDAEEELKAFLGYTATAGDDINKYYNILLKNNDAIHYLKERNINMDVITTYQIGFDGMRYTIPIKDISGNVRNVRKHLKGKVEGQEKTISSLKGIGNIRLFPASNLYKRKLYIFEGEMDVLCAISNGLDAITATGGAGSWKLEFNKYFEDKEIIICYDIDNTGINGAKKIANILSEVSDNISIVSLPIDKLPEHGDFTDFIKQYGIDEFLKLKPEKFTGLPEEEANKIVQEVHLGETTDSKWFNKRIKTVAIVTGKGNLYMCPKKIEATCTNSEGAKCEQCLMSKYKFKRMVTIKPDNKVYLKFVKIADEEKNTLLKRLCGIPLKCPSAKIIVSESLNIEQVAVIPEIDYNATSSASYVSRMIYVVSDIPMESNKPYSIEALVLPFPKTQESTMLAYNFTSTKDNIDMFEMTPDVVDELKIFQANSLEEMKNVLKEKYYDYEAVTGIYKRESLFTAVDISFHSVLTFDFQGRQVKRGYVHTLIFGDTRTGKSETVDHLMNHFRAGDATGGENVTFAGLVGGVHKIASGEKWGITWKIIPLNDRRLVKIDEFHGMHDDDIGKLSELLSTGTASIQKIHSEKTLARTRLLFIANDKYGRHISDYHFGCEAIPVIMGNRNEDIARLDFAVAVGAGDVDLKEMNKLKSVRKEVKKFKSDLCHKLIMWAWSRKKSDIEFTPEAEKLILEIAEKQAAQYHISIPLVPSAEHSVKLARISASVAAMFFSTDEIGRKVIIKEIHVKFAQIFLDNIYSSNSMKYNLYSSYKKNKSIIKNPDEINALGITEDIKDLLLNVDKINQKQIETIFNCIDRDVSRNIMFVLLKNNALVPYGSNLYTKSSAFMKYLITTKFAKDNTGTIFTSNF